MVTTCLLFPIIAQATSDYLIGVWSSEDGLRSSSVTAITQTPDGYLWVGTYNGLARFDGVRFVRFEPDNTPALPRARIRRLYVDANGILWINTYDGSLVSCREGQFTTQWKGDGSADAAITLVCTRSNVTTFVRHTGELLRFRSSNAMTQQCQVLRPPGASSGQLTAEDCDGAIWCRGRDQQLWRLSGDNFQAVTNAGLQGKDIRALAADNRGQIWVGTERELAAWNGTRFEAMTPTNGEDILNVGHLFFTREGDAWVIANERVRKARGRQWVFEAEPCRGVFTGWLDRLGMHEDRAGGLWIYHYGKGIFHIRGDGRTRQLANEENFPGERVDCFHQDREGNLWAGVDRGGLVRIREKHFAVLSPDDGPTVKAAVSVAEGSNGDVWVGTYGGGLNRWQDDKWQGFSLAGGMGRGFVFSVLPDVDGKVWVSSGEEDLFLGRGGKFDAVTPAVHGVKAMLRGSDGRLWIGTKSGLGYLADGRFRRYMPEDGVKRTDIRALVEDKQCSIWAGAGDGTLYHVETNRVTSFQAKDSLAEQPIWSLLADADGTVWAGTFRGGLMRFRDGNFTRFTSKQGLPDDVICQLLDDDQGWLWIGSQQGIFRVAKTNLNACARGDIKTVDCTAYGRHDGLPSLECSGSYQPAAWRTRDGRLLFATLKGVVSVQPNELAPNPLQPPVIIEEVLVDGETALSGEGLNRTATAKLEVPPGKRQVEFRYTALSLVSPDRVRFRYRLEGLGQEWNEAGTRRSAEFSFLRPGNYRFQVTACNNDGVWNTEGDTLEMVVFPHFYQTWWFLTLLGLAATGIVAGTARHFAVRRLRREMERLERQRAVEEDRSRIAKDIHDDLGAGLTHIALLSEVARRSPATEMPSHLTHISDMARELTRAMDETVWAVNPHNDSLEGLMTYVTKFAQDYLNVAGIRCRLDMPAQLPPHHLSAEARHNLYLAVKETLNNVVKHAHATEVWLRLTASADGFILIIEDNGRGITIAGKNGSASGRISTGHGLHNLEIRLAASSGRCIVSSESGKGTRVEFAVTLNGQELR